MNTLAAPAGTGKVFLARTYRQDTASAPDLDAWFPDEEDTPLSRNALDRVSRFLASHGATMKETPTGAGLSLLERMLPEQQQWYPLPDGVQSLVRHELTQACVQHFPHERTIEQILCYDARAAYMSKCHNVPCYFAADDLRWDTDNRYEPFQLGFYEVEVTVPKGWQHVGLAPRRPRLHATYWDYPRTPGETWTVWLDGCEVDLLRMGMGTRDQPLNPWPHKITKRILFSTASGSRKHDPLGAWMKELSGFIERIGDEPKTAELRLIRSAIRGMALQTIGYFHGSDEVYAEVGKDDPKPTGLPLHYRTFPRADGGSEYVWREARRGLMARWNQPQWSANIWAKWRCAVLRKALTVPFRDLLNIYNDALYVTADQGWQEKPNKDDLLPVGSFRIKDTAVFPVNTPAPATGTHLMEMMHHG